jgi:hypothetical protein
MELDPGTEPSRLAIGKRFQVLAAVHFQSLGQ